MLFDQLLPNCPRLKPPRCEYCQRADSLHCIFYGIIKVKTQFRHDQKIVGVP